MIHSLWPSGLTPGAREGSIPRRPNPHAFRPEEIPLSTPAGFAADQLKSFVERIERLEEEKQTIQDDIKDVYAEAKGTGFDVKILRQVIRLRKQDKSEREEQEAVLELYLQALGMMFPTPAEEDA
jgi:uncharacterized protein (UPF0335 family)